MNRGLTNVLTTVIIAVSTVFASALTAWGTSSTRISAVDKEVAEVKITEDLHYKEIQRQLEAIDKKLDAIGTAVKVPIINLATSTVGR